jgi:rhamnogalacturonan endolyase
MSNRTPRRSHRHLRRPAIVDRLESRTLFAFGLTTTSTLYTVDTGAGLVFSILRGGTVTSTLHMGDMETATYNGTSMLAPYSYESRYSHYEEGLSSVAVVSATVDPNNQWILITCDDTATGGSGVIQYYLARNGYDNIYMASYAAGPAAPSPGEMRYIAYTNPSVLTNVPAASNNNGDGGSTAIESSDVFGHPDGTTSSKYYGEYRAIDTQTYGDTGANVGIFMNIGNRETSSGGPFYKDIDFQNNELYTYVFSGHSQTEAFRPGLKGFYALEFTNGTNPGAPDYTWIDSSGAGTHVTGYVGASGRGALTGTASGVPSTLQETVALSNAADQYWALPNTTTGAYTISGVLPGTYAEMIYQGELAVGTRTVTITSGQTTQANITSTLYTPPAASTIFRIGTWDGTPLGFLNANLITYMHPTDVRMSPWAADASGLTNFIVGTSADASFPMAEWHAQDAAAPYVDTDNRITFTLTAAQAATALTFRIGLTRLDSARPNITVHTGTGTAWTSAIQGIATEPDSRGVTTGNWRGNNVTYSFSIPTGKLVAGTNTIDISSVSGSTGTLYSGYHIYDALDLVTTSSITNAPAITTIKVTPALPSLLIGGAQAFVATAYDQFGNVTPANVAWTTTAGAIVNGTGRYTAPSNAGSASVTATSGTVTGSTTVTVVGTTFTASAGDGFYLRLAADGATEQLWIGTPGSVGPAYTATPTYAAPLAGLPSFTFGPGSAVNGTLTVDASNGDPIPSGGVAYDGGAGTDTLALIGTGGTDSITVTGTQVSLGASVITYANTEAIRVTTGAGSDTLTQSAQPGGTLTWTDPTSADALAVNGGTFTFAAPAAGAGIVPLALGSVTVGANAKLTLGTAAAHADRSVLILSATPALGGSTNAWTGSIDLGGNDMIVTAGNLATLTNELKSGSNNGSWNGKGIASTAAAADATYRTALGVMQDDGTTTTFDGRATVSGDVLVKYTYYGDTNLDGVVNVADYTRVDAGFISKGTLAGWLNGDFNYDGSIDGSDYTLIDNAFNTQAVPAAAAVPAVVVTTTAPVAARPIRSVKNITSVVPTFVDDEKKRRHHLM